MVNVSRFKRKKALPGVRSICEGLRMPQNPISKDNLPFHRESFPMVSPWRPYLLFVLLMILLQVRLSFLISYLRSLVLG